MQLPLSAPLNTTSSKLSLPSPASARARGKVITRSFYPENSRVSERRDGTRRGLINKARDQVLGTDAVSKGKDPEPDLIILDVRMPGLNGVEVAGILRSAWPKTRFVLLTMYAEDPLRLCGASIRLWIRRMARPKITEFRTGLLEGCQI